MLAVAFFFCKKTPEIIVRSCPPVWTNEKSHIIILFAPSQFFSEHSTILISFIKIPPEEKFFGGIFHLKIPLFGVFRVKIPTFLTKKSPQKFFLMLCKMSFKTNNAQHLHITRTSLVSVQIENEKKTYVVKQ